MGASSVRRWVKHFKNGNMSIQDQPWSGGPRTTSTERNERVDEIVQDDRRVTGHNSPNTWIKAQCSTGDD